jgi:two-component system alkaline phosphatase synthesis response regulator PhoP
MPTGQKILLVDDNEDILEILGYNLKQEGYNVITATNGHDAIEMALKSEPDLIVLDIMMPGIDGVETCEIMRQDEKLKGTFIVFLSARAENYSQIAGFNAGGDDYITKPIHPKVFLSKVKAILSRGVVTTKASTNILDIANISIDRDNFSVTKNGEEIILPRKEFELLSLLASRPNKVFNRHEIYIKIWGKNTIVGDRTIDVHISKLREILNISNIKTIKGVGYKFELK